jgi:hypothetical protein
VTFDVLTREPLVSVSFVSGEESTLTLSDLVRRSHDIAIVHADSLTRLALAEMCSVFALEALEHSGVIDKTQGDVNDMFDALYVVTPETLSTAVDKYLPVAGERGWFDLDHPHGMGQVSSDILPSNINAGDFSALDYRYEVELSTRMALDKRTVALAILTLRHRGRGGVHKTVDVQGAVKYPLAGTVLRAPMAFVEFQTFGDTILGMITAEMIEDTSLPSWRVDPPSSQGDDSGTRITGPRIAMTTITRIPWLEFDDEGVLVSAAVTAGECLTRDNMNAYTQTMKFVIKDGELKSPVGNYGNVHPSHVQSVFTVTHTVNSERNRAVDSAAAYASVKELDAVRVTSITAVHSNLSKIGSIAADTFTYPVSLFPSTVSDPKMQQVIAGRSDLTSHCAVRTGKCAFVIHSAVLDIEKPISEKSKKSEVADTVRADLLNELGSRFQEWISEIPPLPPSSDDVDTAMEDHLSLWNKMALKTSIDALDEYMSSMPQQWWLSRDAAGRRAKAIAGLKTSLELSKKEK